MGFRPAYCCRDPLRYPVWLSYLAGSVHEPILDFAFRAIKLAIIMTLVKNASEYQTYVTNIFSNSCRARFRKL